jgi:hypothetical protein
MSKRAGDEYNYDLGRVGEGGAVIYAGCRKNLRGTNMEE